MGNKIKITLPKNTQKEVEFYDKIVKIDDYISLEKCDTIISDIKSMILYNSEIENKFALIYPRYIKDVLDLCTNIDTAELGGEDLNSPALEELLKTNLINFERIYECAKKEYEKWIIENSFGSLGNKLPTPQEMEESMKKLSETIENLPEDKLELIIKSIVWNNMPVLGNQIAPAEHISPITEA